MEFSELHLTFIHHECFLLKCLDTLGRILRNQSKILIIKKRITDILFLEVLSSRRDKMW